MTKGRPPVVSRKWLSSSSVQRWKSSGIRASTYEPYYYKFADFMDYLKASGSKFADMTPDQLIEYQIDADRRHQYEILSLVEEWTNQGNGIRRGTKANKIKAIKSFFASNHADLPPDKRFRIQADTPPLPPNALKVEMIKRVLDKSNQAYRAAYLIMFGSFIDQDTFERWNLDGWEDLKPQLKNGADQIEVKIPGRKNNKNQEWFTTRFGGDALSELRIYVDKVRGWDDVDYVDGDGKHFNPIFLNQFKEPISKQSLSVNWLAKLKALNLTKKQRGRATRYGLGLHQLRDVAYSLWQMHVPETIGLADTMMGHKVSTDRNGYAHLDDSSWCAEKYDEVLPYLNLLSRDEPYGTAPRDVVNELRRKADRVPKLEEEIKSLQRRITYQEMLKPGEVKITSAEPEKASDSDRLLEALKRLLDTPEYRKALKEIIELKEKST